MTISKEEYGRRAQQIRLGFIRFAGQLKKEHPAVLMMGPLAWGRHDEELSVSNINNLRNIVIVYGFLKGAKDIINRWCRDNDQKAQALLLKETDESKPG